MRVTLFCCPLRERRGEPVALPIVVSSTRNISLLPTFKSVSVTVPIEVYAFLPHPVNRKST